MCILLQWREREVCDVTERNAQPSLLGAAKRVEVVGCPTARPVSTRPGHRARPDFSSQALEISGNGTANGGGSRLILSARAGCASHGGSARPGPARNCSTARNFRRKLLKEFKTGSRSRAGSSSCGEGAALPVEPDGRLRPPLGFLSSFALSPNFATEVVLIGSVCS